MKKGNIQKLLQRYLDASEEGREPYFDADEIDYLLDSFEESDDFTHYEGVLALGMKLYPLSPDLELRRCKLYLYKEEYQEALKLLDSITKDNDFEVDMLRLECYCSLDQFARAINYVKELENNNCEYLEDIYEFLTPILCDSDMMEEARDLIYNGLQLFPDNPILKEELCFIYETEGLFQDAIMICNELIDKDPYSYNLWFTLGRLYSLVAEYEKAIDAFDFALTCDDSDLELKVLKAYCLFMNESYRKAIEVYQEVAIDDDSKDRIKPLMAECYIKLEEYENAYQLLKEIMEIKRGTLEAATYIHFIRCCVETDREKEASALLMQAVNVFPENVRLLSLLALSYLENGKEEQALSITNKIFNQLDKFLDENTTTNFPLISRPEKYIPIKDLTKEYLNNKDNNN